MNDPVLYQNSNSQTRQDAIYVFEHYSTKIKWKKSGDKIADIGCADGGKIEIYKKYLPYNYGKIVGCDISPIMVEYAEKKFGDEKTTFRVLDIDDDIPADMVKGFDHVFAFFVLHWLKDQRVAFTKFYKLLDAGGDCVISHISYSQFFEAYRIMSLKQKWSPYMLNSKHSNVHSTSPFQDSQNKAREIENFMNEAGFKGIEVKCLNKTFTYDNMQHVKNFLTAVNSYKIPEHLLSEYMDDLIQVIKENNILKMVVNEKGEMKRARVNYIVIIAYGSK